MFGEKFLIYYLKHVCVNLELSFYWLLYFLLINRI